MYTKNRPILEAIERKKVLVAAHRGTCGGILSGIPAFLTKMHYSMVQT